MADQESQQSFISPRSRARASEACRQCREKKIKCNVTSTGVPCSNCTRRGHPETCALRSRKPYPPRRSRKNVNGFVEQSSSNGGQSEKNVDSPDVVIASADSPGALDYQLRQPKSSKERVSKFANAILGEEKEGDAPFFVGDEQGIGNILDVFEPGRLARGKHYLIPRSTVRALSSEDLAYLRAKGVFSLPDDNVCEALLRCFFHHVHPTTPVVEVRSVLGAYLQGGAKRVNLLLLWCMFAVATNFLDDKMPEAAGYKSRKDMKDAMYRRAKCLYDCNCEDNKVTLIQAALLMSFWYVDTDERTESWHWLGIAIGLSQTLGLHRDPDSGQRNSRLTDRSRRVWRRMWWSCFYRDRWLSFIMGRPMRINTRDCDVPFPTVGDIMNDYVDLPSAAWGIFIPRDIDLLAEGWVAFLRLTKILGDICSINYGPHRVQPSIADTEAWDREIRGSLPQFDATKTSQNPVLDYYQDHLQIFQQATIIALYRPFAPKRLNQTPEESDGLQQMGWQKLKSAASKTNSVLEKIISADTVKYLGPMIIPTLLPAMQTHLLESTSPNQLSRNMGLHKLELCMMVLREVESCYNSARFILGVFSEATDRLNAAAQHGERNPQSTPRGQDKDKSAQGASSSESSELPTLAYSSTVSVNPSSLDDAWSENMNAFTDPWDTSGQIGGSVEELQFTPDFDVNNLLNDEEFQKLFVSMQNSVAPGNQ